jgi:hypothetical protein
MGESRLLRRRAAAEYLGISVKLLARLRDSGQLRVVEMWGRQWYDRADLDAVVEQLKSTRPCRSGGGRTRATGLSTSAAPEADALRSPTPGTYPERRSGRRRLSSSASSPRAGSVNVLRLPSTKR